MRIAVVPGTLALQDKYASLTDPIPELRAAVLAARAWADQVFVVNGSARRTQASPGPYDERAVGFDEALFAALTTADAAALRATDQTMARDLWASTEALPDVAAALEGQDWAVTVDFDDAPTGVAWWVLRYES